MKRCNKRKNIFLNDKSNFIATSYFDSSVLPNSIRENFLQSFQLAIHYSVKSSIQLVLHLASLENPNHWGMHWTGIDIPYHWMPYG